MLLPDQEAIRSVLLLVVWLYYLRLTTAQKDLCPVGFRMTYRKDDTRFCIKRKGPETFADAYKDCVGNLYTSTLYQQLNNSKPNHPIWTEYKSLYPGGDFVDWSYTKSIGRKFESKDDVTFDHTLDFKEDMCLVMDPDRHFTAVKCNTRHYRFCVVQPHVVKRDSKIWRVWRHAPIYLSHHKLFTAVTWDQAQKICGGLGTSLLTRGWRYIQPDYSLRYTLPLGIVMSSDHSVLRYDTLDDHSEVPADEWRFEDNFNNTNNHFGALRNGFWHLVNGSKIFNKVVCERSVPIKNVILNLTIDIGNKLRLAVNDSLDMDDIHCFTDSLFYYPVKVEKQRADSNVYMLKSKHDGYYWCTHSNTRHFTITESKKVLFIRKRDSLVNFYAIKLKYRKPYSLTDISSLYKALESRLKEYIYLRTNNETGLIDRDLMMFPDWREKTVIVKMRIKRLYLDRYSVLVHVDLYTNMKPVTPGFWRDVEILSMKPVFYCKGFGSVSQASLGQFKSVGYQNHICTGDFNEGVQWVTTTFTPEEKLDQVMGDVDNLINKTTPVVVSDINNVFDEVNNLLEDHDSLKIPSRLLHLLDYLGTNINLNGSRNATVVRDNIALVVADAEPNHPVRGMRISKRDNVFTEGAFQIISDELNSTDFDSEINEEVVIFPQSVSNGSRRISFVVFRNDRAFHASDGSYSVNSRVLSIKVENVTHFENGEVIEIRHKPITSQRYYNMNRACAYWSFIDNETGFWSTDGCTLIRATQTGQLDTCRCNHLTHFAEVLFPRSVFSQKNEDILELLTVIGCCVSMFGLAMVGVTALMFRAWRHNYNNKIWLLLCISIFVLVLSFLIIIFAKFDHYTTFCMIIGVMLHYSVLSSFCWMLVAAVLSFKKLVLVFTTDGSHRLLKASVFSWGVPFVIIGVLLAVSPNSYAERFEGKTCIGSFCYPSGLSLWLALYAPIALILLVNWILFVFIFYYVFVSRRTQRHGDSSEAFRCVSVSCLLMFLFGLPWVSGLFAFNAVAAYFFTITATYQGFVLFLFIVVGNKNTRDLWLNKLKARKVFATNFACSYKSGG